MNNSSGFDYYKETGKPLKRAKMSDKLDLSIQIDEDSPTPATIGYKKFRSLEPDKRAEVERMMTEKGKMKAADLEVLENLRDSYYQLRPDAKQEKEYYRKLIKEQLDKVRGY